MNHRTGIPLVAFGLALALFIDGAYTGNPGSLHGIVTGWVWWGGQALIYVGFLSILSHLFRHESPTVTGILSLMLVPGPLMQADHFLMENPPLLAHTALAGILAMLSLAAATLVFRSTIQLLFRTLKEAQP